MTPVIHSDLCGKLGHDKDETYYNHGPQPVYESTHNKLLWDFKIPTDNEIEHNKPEIVVLDKTEWKCQIIDVACPSDTRVKDKGKEKFENYQDLKLELKRIRKIPHNNSGASHNWCIRRCLERHREVASIAEIDVTCLSHVV